MSTEEAGLRSLSLLETFNTVLVESQQELERVVKALARHRIVAFDSEGSNLSRKGDLTVASFLGLDNVGECNDSASVYLFDVKKLGKSAFSDIAPSLKPLLEDPSIRKITFDCRQDSDALYHQFGVTLRGVRELQVLEQAVRINSGEEVPTRNPYLKRSNIPFLKSMANTAQKYLSDNKEVMKWMANKQTTSHDTLWEHRPLSDRAINYASWDVYTIKLLYEKLHEVGELPEVLERAVEQYSARYESAFRDRATPLSSYSEEDKNFKVEEVPIVDPEAISRILGPRTLKSFPSYKNLKPLEKWDSAVKNLKNPTTDKNKAFNDVLFVLQHDYWYTSEGFQEIRRLADEFPFTSKQRGIIRNPPPLPDADDYDNYGDYGGSDSD